MFYLMLRRPPEAVADPNEIWFRMTQRGRTDWNSEGVWWAGAAWEPLVPPDNQKNHSLRVCLLLFSRGN
jgi:hypothetical protein